MKKLRLMSNNLWWNTFNTPEWEALGADCSNEARVPGFARMYRETQPDVIGLQECSETAAMCLRSISAAVGIRLNTKASARQRQFIA